MQHLGVIPLNSALLLIWTEAPGNYLDNDKIISYG